MANPTVNNEIIKTEAQALIETPSFEGIGRLLRATREKSNISIDDIAERIKIRKQWLEQIENGDLNHLPGAIYIIGFTRNYAHYLGLNSEKIIDALKNTPDFQTGKFKSPSKKTPLANPQAVVDMEATNVSTPYLLLGAALLFAGYYSYNNFFASKPAEYAHASPGTHAAETKTDEELTTSSSLKVMENQTEAAIPPKTVADINIEDNNVSASHVIISKDDAIESREAFNA